VKLRDAAGAHESNDAVSDACSSVISEFGRHARAKTRSIRRRRVTEVADDDAETDAEHCYSG